MMENGVYYSYLCEKSIQYENFIKNEGFSYLAIFKTYVIINLH